MRNKNLVGILAGILLVSLIGGAQTSEKPHVVNIMIDADISASASKEQGIETSESLKNIHEILLAKDIGATIFVPQDIVRSYAKLRVTEIGRDPKIELALSGNHSGEKLSVESLSDQRQILKTSKEYVEYCRVCGENEIIALGFLPQSFDQNKDTYKVLDELGIKYDAGFQAGVIYAPGHQDDVWPYKLEGYELYAVPVSTIELSGQKVPLQDMHFNESGLSSDVWYDALKDKFDESQGKNEPMVILLTKSVSGSGDYLDALKRFIDFATSKDANFVTTMDLVNISRGEAYVPFANDTGECTTCGQKENKSMITITSSGGTINNTATEGCPTCGQKNKTDTEI